VEQQNDVSTQMFFFIRMMYNLSALVLEMFIIAKKTNFRDRFPKKVKRSFLRSFLFCLVSEENYAMGI
jgi:hypothetical protein